MSLRPKTTPKYRFNPVNSLSGPRDHQKPTDPSQRTSNQQSDASSSPLRSNINDIRRRTRKIGELDEEIEVLNETSELKECKVFSHRSDVNRLSKRTKMESSDDSTMFWKVSPRQKRIKQIDSSPSKLDDDSILVGDESISDLFHVELSPERLRNANGINNENLKNNNLNESILQSLKSIKADQYNGQVIDNKAVLDNGMASLLHQIGTSMMNSPTTAVHLPTTTDSFNVSPHINGTLESDSFSDDDDNGHLIMQLTQNSVQRPAIRNQSTATVTTDTKDDIFSDDIEENRPFLRTNTKTTELFVDTKVNIEDDSFSDDNETPILSKKSSFKLFDETENLAKCVIDCPTLHRFQIKEIKEVQYKVKNQTKTQKILTCLNKDDSFTTILVRDLWCDLDMKISDVIHVVTAHKDDRFQLVDKDHNLLIWHPDELVSPTKIGSAAYCPREAVINDKFRGPGTASVAFIIGNITHSLFQTCLRYNKVDDEYINSFIEQKLDEYIIDIYSTDSTRNELKETIVSNSDYIKTWIKTYMDPNSSSDMKVSKILDIEESIMSPTFGIRGFIDVVIEMLLSDGKFVVPMEIKSGKEYLSNKAQVAMYTLLIRDRYDVDSKFTDLVYTKLKKNSVTTVKYAELKHLIQLRNTISQYMIYGQTELPPIKQRASCERCFSLEPCMVLNKLVEDGTPESSGIDVDMFSSFTDHLNSPQYTAFFKHWDLLITKEEGYLKYTKSDLWKYTAKQREETGGHCIGGLKLFKCEYSSKSHKYVYEFKRSNNGIMSKITKYDTIIISEDGGRKIGLADGTVRYVDKDIVIISTERKWIDSTIKESEFDSTNNQVFKSVLNLQGTDISEVVKEKTFRIDKNFFVMGLSMARWNLLNLFLPGGDTKRREIIVELKTPNFGEPQWVFDSDHFNDDQQRALDFASRTDDYLLILGMPGTGKTTVISHMIKAIVQSGKTVLITSYTHSAVDNICEKLVEIMGSDLPLLRLGSTSKIKANLKSYCPYSDEFMREDMTKEIYNEIIDSKQIVAVTCLGVGDGVFGKTFDYCVVDEASQVALPVVLGPLQYADKFILVGDHYQLPPLVVNPEARIGGLDQSLFQILNDSHPEAVVELTRQYRMNEDIMTISNDLIYNGRLKCGNEQVAKQKLNIEWVNGSEWVRNVMDPLRSVVFVNYDKMNAQEVKNGDQIENPGEVDLISELITCMVSSGVSVDDIGLMSFYNGQLIKFKQSLAPNIVDKLEMLTADKFQGRDKDVIIISLVRTQGIGGLLKEWRRINVAMTRAKKKLIVFGHGGLMRKEMRDLMNAFDSRGWTIEPKGQFQAVKRGRTPAIVNRKPPGSLITAVLDEMEG